MCECYDPNGPKYCEVHKETMTGKSNKIVNSYGLENLLTEFAGKDNKDYN